MRSSRQRRAGSYVSPKKDVVAMANFGLFFGFGVPARGREIQASKVFGETMAYWNQRKAAGEIESIEVAILEPHGGDLGGFVLIRGEPQNLAQLQGSEEFRRLNLRAGFAVEGFGVVTALLDDEAARFVATANDVTADLR
jgi:hypothetical protein